MDARQAVRQALQSVNSDPAVQEPTLVLAANEDDEKIGELQVAEYVIFLFALDTYMRYVEETTGKEDAEDEVIHKGIRLLRVADQELDSVKGFLSGHLPSDAHKRMLARALMTRASTVAMVGRRALQLRTLLSRGGPATMRAVFESNRALRQVREAINASMMDDADAALDLFAAIPLRNLRLAAWIDLAAKTAGTGEVVQSPVEIAAKEAVDQAKGIVADGIQELAAVGAEESKLAQEAQTEKLQQVQLEAAAAAKKVLEKAGEPDEPLTRSETIGVATAAAIAAVSDPSNPRNVPDSLVSLDDEQRAAALTDGRVGVFAGAGAGKSTTLVARVTYLVKERRVAPGRIFVTSFNKKAANELEEKIGKQLGKDALDQISVGTMHRLFKRFVGEYGTSEEKIQLGLGPKGGPNGNVGGGDVINRAVQRMWEECFKKEPLPKLKTMLVNKSKWSGNDISPSQAMGLAKTTEEAQAARWYEMYEGLKGSIPGWKPPCPSKSYEAFMARNRPRGMKLGDFTDMLKIFRDILRRDSRVREAVQRMYDHIIVDEAQDRNTLMAEVVELMSQHVSDGSDGKSLWIVGDDKQAINAFMGAKSELFSEIFQKDGWKTRVIRTNYRCEPEIVDAANKLIAFNSNNIPIPAVPAPGKPRGVGSIQLSAPMDESAAALEVVEEIKQNLVNGGNITDHSVLCRTNKELHSYETACIIRGIPYARRGASSFLGSPETKAVLGYVQLVTGTDFAKAQTALADVINKPNRFFISDPKKIPEAVDDAFTDYARRTGVDKKAINPLTAMSDRSFVYRLAGNLARLTRTGKGFKFEQKIEDLAWALSEMKAKSADESYTTKDLFDEILGLKGTAIKDGAFVDQTFRESIEVDLKNMAGGDEGDVPEDEDDDETKGLGNVSFLYQLAQIDPTDENDEITPPTTPFGFAAKMARYASRMKDLRTDVEKWAKEQESLSPEKRSPPPGVYLGTVHSVKGAQWKTTFVQMPKGKFPLERPPRPGELPPDPEVVEQQLQDERRLAYVALTRAAKNLRVICPRVVGGNAGGISVFADEAGLALGENVARPGTAEEAEAKGADLMEESTTTKTASFEEDDLTWSEALYVDEDIDESLLLEEAPTQAWVPEEG